MADAVIPAPAPSTGPVIEPKYSGRMLSQGGTIQHHEGEAFIPPGAKMVIPQKSVFGPLSAATADLDKLEIGNPLAVGGFDNTGLYVNGAKLPSDPAEVAKILVDALSKGDATIENKAKKQAYLSLRVNVIKKA